ncbi:MAG TPA: tryptophan tryptophylquinone biosynthesis enzyme MauG [Gammaproteobacteria bacterium]|nr:tryptophan tryptophylquinone biosynthesis enzyme MauG [Gammaproteobacteria bacterium]
MTRKGTGAVRSLVLAGAVALTTGAGMVHAGGEMVFKAGDPTLQQWLLPEEPPYPEDNKPTPERITLGKMLFFDPRLSGDGNMSCATCHNPAFGWSDGLPTARGHKSMVLGRATPTVINTAYNTIQMWDGRKRDLEDQATGPMEASVEMNSDFDRLFRFLNGNRGYSEAFAKAYPGEGINKETLAKAIASFERTILSNDSPFDRWVKGDASAMTEQQVRGFRIFVDPNKGNCAICHSAPNFTDNGFHNLGLASDAGEDADPGRFAQKPIKILKGAFKTPTLRDVALTAPYFHDGSAQTLMDVVEHYVRGGVVKERLSPNIRPLDLTAREKEDLVAFLEALTTRHEPVTLPELPLR